jgi:hypothetical protein
MRIGSIDDIYKQINQNKDKIYFEQLPDKDTETKMYFHVLIDLKLINEHGDIESEEDFNYYKQYIIDEYREYIYYFIKKLELIIIKN